VDALPGNRLIGAVTGPHRFQGGAAEPDFLMTIHASFGRRQAGEWRGFHAGMTVTAIDTELSDVVLVAERNGLYARYVGIRHVRRPAEDIKRRPLTVTPGRGRLGIYSQRSSLS
jgi:hypothetical protein